MKTQNNNQEREISQVSKMVLYGSTIALGVLSISMTANAQDFWKQFTGDNSYGKMTSLFVGESFETEKTDAVFEIINAEISAKLKNSNASFIYEPEMEESLELESWMTEESFFSSTVDFTAVETEENLEIENWMTNNNNFSSPVIPNSIEMENPLELEPWMTTEEFFNSPEVIENAEPAFEIEPWMTTEELFFKAPNLTAEETDGQLNVEEWMTSEHIFNNQAALIATGSEPALQIQAWMFNENYFTAGEFYSDKGTERKMLKYAQNR